MRTVDPRRPLNDPTPAEREEVGYAASQHWPSKKLFALLLVPTFSHVYFP